MHTFGARFCRAHFLHSTLSTDFAVIEKRITDKLRQCLSCWHQKSSAKSFWQLWETGQQHIVNYIREKGDIRAEIGDNLPLDEAQMHTLHQGFC